MQLVLPPGKSNLRHHRYVPEKFGNRQWTSRRIGWPRKESCERVYIERHTELAFDENIKCDSLFGNIFPNKKIGQRLARFRQINTEHAASHHDALEFPDGQVVLLTRLCEGQRATVLQLPAAGHPAAAKEAVRPEVRAPRLFA